MKDIPSFINSWLGLFPSLKSLHQIYESLDSEIENWTKQSKIQCPQGCGTCCTNFEPRVSSIEALYLATFYMDKHPDHLELINSLSEVPPCFFYDPSPESSKGHCMVYEGRPLVCRLFGFSATRDKHQSLVFRLCKVISTTEDRIYSEETMMQKFNALPPEMNRFSSQIDSLNTGSQLETQPLKQAVEKSLLNLHLKQSYLNLEKSSGLNNHNVNIIA